MEEKISGFYIAERYFSNDESKPSVALANIHAEVPDIGANKDKILKAIEIFKERKVNIAISQSFVFPVISGRTNRPVGVTWTVRSSKITRIGLRIVLDPRLMTASGASF